MAKRPYHHGDLRAAMLTAAEAVLERAGPDGLTLRAAAREAGVSHAAPVHHFGDLSGLLSVLAASGFDRFRAHLLSAADAAGAGSRARLAASCAAYIGFARAHPGMFQLMFRSSNLDWSSPALAEAAGAAFALLTSDQDGVGEPDALSGFDRLVLALSRWSMAHGAALLSLDGRLDALAAGEGAPVEALIAAIVRQLPADFRPAGPPGRAPRRCCVGPSSGAPCRTIKKPSGKR